MRSQAACFGRWVVLGSLVLGVVVVGLRVETGKPGFSLARAAGTTVAQANPEPADETSLARGKEVFQKYCVPCHGVNGDGKGPKGPEVGAADFTDQTWEHGGTDAEIFHTISEGVAATAMPSWKNIISEADRWNLVNYVKTFSQPKPSS